MYRGEIVLKKSWIFILCLSLFLVACSNEKVGDQTNSEQKEKSIGSLVKEINNYVINKEYTKAVEIYEELGDLTSNNYDEDIEKLIAKEKGYKNDIRIVNEIKEHLDEALFNPESLQLHKVFIEKFSMDDEDYEIYIDYSAMNKMGGYARDYLEWEVKNSALQNFTQIEPELFKQQLELHKSTIIDDSYEFDLSLIKE